MFWLVIIAFNLLLISLRYVCVLMKTREMDLYIATGPRTLYFLVTRSSEWENRYWKSPRARHWFLGYSECSLWCFSITTSRTGSISDLKPFHRRKELKPQRHVIGGGVTRHTYHWIIRIPLCYWIIRAEIAQILDEHWLDGGNRRLATETTAKKTALLWFAFRFDQ
jgi:hypothetical protein